MTLSTLEDIVACFVIAALVSTTSEQAQHQPG
jgi:hypothetical protein